jgi:hypothetical protein
MVVLLAVTDIFVLDTDGGGSIRRRSSGWPYEIGQCR